MHTQTVGNYKAIVITDTSDQTSLLPHFLVKLYLFETALGNKILKRHIKFVFSATRAQKTHWMVLVVRISLHCFSKTER